MSSEIAIKVEGLSKCYQIYEHPRDRLKQFVLPKLNNLLGKPGHNYYKEFWALNNVSFEVKKGETVGIIGRNGSGKSTLLQLICGTLNPTGGSITTNGRIAALLELGSGFNPEFTGRENVYMSCALLGLSQQEVESKFDDIAAFADIGDHLDQPVKTYSSGMFVRLAFAVNVISSPDIMVVDEALAVGDMNFQAKCMTALTRFQEHGGTVLFVSHDVGSIKSLCRQAVYLEHGQVMGVGPAPDIAEHYVRLMREEMSEDIRKFARVSSEFNKNRNIETASSDADSDNSKSASDLTGDNNYSDQPFKRSVEFDRRVATMRYGSGGVRITYAELLDLEGNQLQIVCFNQEVRVVIYVEAECQKKISVGFKILDEKRISITGCAFAQVGHNALSVNNNDCYRVEYRLCLPLQEGVYSLVTQVTEPNHKGQPADFLDVVNNAVIFKVEKWSLASIWSKVHLFPRLSISSN